MLSRLRRLFRREPPPTDDLRRKVDAAYDTVDHLIPHLARAQIEIEALRRRVDDLERRSRPGGGCDGQPVRR